MGRTRKIAVLPFSREKVNRGDIYFMSYRDGIVPFKVRDVESDGFYYDNPPVYVPFKEARGVILRASSNERNLELISNTPLTLTEK